MKACPSSVQGKLRHFALPHEIVNIATHSQIQSTLCYRYKRMSLIISAMLLQLYIDVVVMVRLWKTGNYLRNR